MERHEILTLLLQFVIQLLILKRIALEWPAEWLDDKCRLKHSRLPGSTGELGDLYRRLIYAQLVFRLIAADAPESLILSSASDKGIRDFLTAEFLFVFAGVTTAVSWLVALLLFAVVSLIGRFGSKTPER